MSIGQVKKSIPTLPNKEKYVLHYRSLHLYMDLGLKVTESYIEFCNLINPYGWSIILTYYIEIDHW